MTDTARGQLRLRLSTRLLLVTGFLLLFAVGSAVVFTSYFARRISRDAVEEALASSSSVLTTSQARRYEQLQLISRLFVADPYLTAYVAEAAEAGDGRSILDLLVERQGDLGYDFAILTGWRGRVLARTDRPDAFGQDLSDRPLVAQALESFEASGVWREGEDLYYAVAVPLVQGVDLLGFLITGFAIDEASAREVQRISGTEIVFAATEEGGLVPVAGTLAPSLAERVADLLQTRPGEPSTLSEGEGSDRETDSEAFELILEGEPWIAAQSPLLDAAGEPVGATLRLASLGERLAPYQRIQTVMLGAGAVSLLLAVALTYLLARGIVRPLQQLVQATAAARRGDYDQPIAVERADEVGELADAFDDLLRDLRERRDMEAYVSELSRNLPDPHGAGLPVGEPRRLEVTLLAVELRERLVMARDDEPTRVLEHLGEELRRTVHQVTAHKGRVAAVVGHRLWAVFEGEDRSRRALEVAVRVAAGWHEGRNGDDEDRAPVQVLTSGPVVAGPVIWEEEPYAGILGVPVQQLESLLREATPGEILLSREVYGELEEHFEVAGYALAQRRGLTSAVPLYNLSPQVAARVVGVVWPPASAGHDLRRELPAGEGQTPDRRDRRMAAEEGGTAPAETMPAGGGETVPVSASEGVPGFSTLSRLGPGSVVGDRFEILALLGSGGMGVVYKARDRSLGDVVALKMLRPDKLGDREQVERLKEELRLARKIAHPNVLRTYDLGEIGGNPFISMELIRGITLRYLLDRSDQRLPYSAALRLARQICQGLGAVHRGGVIHRDIKPDNVILEPSGNAKLMDFGIARPSSRSPLAGGELTGTGMIIGTPGYLSPEQLRGGAVDARSDIYSCGAVFYEMFTGDTPFRGSTLAERLVQTLQEEPPSPTDIHPGLDPRLEAILLRCLRKDPAERFQSVDQLLEALERLDR